MKWLVFILVFPGMAEGGMRWSGPACDTLGVHLQGWSRVEAEGPTLPGYHLAYHVTEQHPDLEWFSFGVFHGDSVLRWPVGPLGWIHPGRDSVLVRWPLYPVLYVGGQRIAPMRAFVVGAPPRLFPLPLTHGQRLDPGELYRLRFQGKGAVASIIFAGYPRGSWDTGKAERVRLEPTRLAP